MMFVMVKAMNDTLIITNMKGTFKMERLMVKEYILGLMVRFMMENGKMESKKVTGFGKEYLAILTLASGRIVKLMDMEFINGKMGISMKASGEIV
jgi:hypothetical protein